MSAMRIGSATAAPGELGFGSFSVGKLSDSTSVEVPVIIVNGAKVGPTLMLSGALHGTEPVGTEIIRRVCRELVDPQALSGSIIALPIANPYGYRAASYYNTEDGHNIQRCFPGDPHGSSTSRLAHALMENALKHANYIIDIHSMCEPSILYSTVKRTGDTELDRSSLDLGRAFGLPIAVSQVSPNHPWVGSLVTAGAELGIPGMSTELQYWRRILPRSAQIGARGTLNVLRALGMLEGAMESQEQAPIGVPSLFRVVDMFSNEGGLVEIPLTVGEAVRRGDIVARIRNPFGDVVENVTSPADGFLVGYPIFDNQAVRTGEMLVFIGVPLDD